MLDRQSWPFPHVKLLSLYFMRCRKNESVAQIPWWKGHRLLSETTLKCLQFGFLVLLFLSLCVLHWRLQWKISSVQERLIQNYHKLDHSSWSWANGCIPDALVEKKMEGCWTHSPSRELCIRQAFTQTYNVQQEKIRHLWFDHTLSSHTTEKTKAEKMATSVSAVMWKVILHLVIFNMKLHLLSRK